MAVTTVGSNVSLRSLTVVMAEKRIGRGAADLVVPKALLIGGGPSMRLFGDKPKMAELDDIFHDFAAAVAGSFTDAKRICFPSHLRRERLGQSTPEKGMVEITPEWTIRSLI